MCLAMGTVPMAEKPALAFLMQVLYYYYIT